MRRHEIYCFDAAGTSHQPLLADCLSLHSFVRDRRRRAHAPEVLRGHYAMIVFHEGQQSARNVTAVASRRDMRGPFSLALRRGCVGLLSQSCQSNLSNGQLSLASFLEGRPDKFYTGSAGSMCTREPTTSFDALVAGERIATALGPSDCVLYQTCPPGHRSPHSKYPLTAPDLRPFAAIQDAGRPAQPVIRPCCKEAACSSPDGNGRTCFLAMVEGATGCTGCGTTPT